MQNLNIYLEPNKTREEMESAVVGNCIKDYTLHSENSVTLWSLEKGESTGSLFWRAKRNCYVLETVTNGSGMVYVFDNDEIQEALDITLKFINLIKA